MKKLLVLSMVWFCCSSFTRDIDKVMKNVEAGNVKAQYQAGWYYANTQRDCAKAIMWLKNQQKNMHPHNTTKGIVITTVWGVKKDMTQAIYYWYEKGKYEH